MRPYFKSFAKELRSIFAASPRSYVTRARVPGNVVQALEDEFKKMNLDGKQLKDNISDQVFERAGQKIVDYAQSAADQGCEDSKDFVRVTKELRDKKVSGIFLSNMPPERDARNFFIKAITAFFGYFSKRTNYPNSLHDYDTAGHVKDLQPHTDYEIDDNGKLVTIPFLSLYGINSPGGPKTYVVELKDVLSNLSEKSLEVLSQTHFYYHDFIKSQKIAVMDFDENGQNKINYGFTLTYDYKNTSAQQHQEIYAALHELRQVIDNAPRQDFELKTGDFLAFDNYQNIHGRTSDKIAEGEARHIEVETFSAAKSEKNVVPNSDVDVTKVECLVGDNTRER